jgi:hypothetical protein
MKFNFITNDEIIVDGRYSSRNINNIFVNEINFIDIDNKIKKLNETVYNFKKKITDKKLKPIKILKLNEDSDETLITNDENEGFDSDISSNEDNLFLDKNNKKIMTPQIKLLKSENKKKLSSTLIIKTNFADTLSPFQNFKHKVNSSTELFQFPRKSILKSRSNRSSIKSCKCKRKVSFGKIEFKY